MDLGVASGVVGALVGVLFGAYLTDRSQRGLQRSGQRYEYLRWRETVFADFLVAYNQMRRLLVSTPVQVRLSQPPAGDVLGTPLIEGVGTQWEALERANSRIQMLAGGTEVDKAAWAAMRDIFRLARHRVTVGPGELPKDVIDESSNVIDRFVKAAQKDLQSGHWRGQFRP